LTAQIHDHQSESLVATVPLMVIDAWEHAWYLQYQNEKAKFFDAIWNVWNWNDIAKRYTAAQKLNLALEAPQATGAPRKAAG
jgi:Fe-Mn family superoxide dismutase